MWVCCVFACLLCVCEAHIRDTSYIIHHRIKLLHKITSIRASNNKRTTTIATPSPSDAPHTIKKIRTEKKVAAPGKGIRLTDTHTHITQQHTIHKCVVWVSCKWVRNVCESKPIIRISFWILPLPYPPPHQLSLHLPHIAAGPSNALPPRNGLDHNLEVWLYKHLSFELRPHTADTICRMWIVKCLNSKYFISSGAFSVGHRTDTRRGKKKEYIRVCGR